MQRSPMDLLAPYPKRAELTARRLRIPTRPGLALHAPPSATEPTIEPEIQRLSAALSALGLSPTTQDNAAGDSPTFLLTIDPAVHGSPEAYRLDVGSQQARIIGAEPAGLHHGVSTLIQWLRLHAPLPQSAAESAANAKPDGAPSTLPGLRVTDWPDFPHRGVMLDISRDKVPTLDTLFALVDRLSEWKINQLQLYTEHTFAYRGHEAVWRDASPMTPEEIRELDGYCAERFIELVPNQNSFGHFHRWLSHERYRPLAECPAGIAHPFGDRVEPFSLCAVDPASLELLAELYDQLLPNFRSTQLNVGLDETFDLGQGRSAEACATRGREEVYLDFLNRVHELASARGHSMQFWADIIIRRPDLIPRLPRNATALEWGYEADHPFEEHLEVLSRAGLPIYVCPGTSSWNSLAGRTDNALANLSAAARAGHAAGAAGYLITDWGDWGHLQPLPISYPGLLAGACNAWNADAPPTHDSIAPLLDAHVLFDPHALRSGTPAGGAALRDLGNAHLHCGARPKNGTALFYLLIFAGSALTERRFRGLSLTGLERTAEHLDACLATLARARMARTDAALITRELTWTGNLLQLACSLGRARLEAGAEAPVSALPAPDRQALLRTLAPLVEQHEPLWLARNRPGGRRDSRQHIAKLISTLENRHT